MTPPWFVGSFEPGRVNAHSAAKLVVLRGKISTSVLSEIEVISSTDAGLNPSAINQASATPQSHEVFFTVQFGPG